MKKIKENIIRINNNPEVIIPLTREASFHYGKKLQSGYCQPSLEKHNEFNLMFHGYELDYLMFFVFSENNYIIILEEDTIHECFNDNGNSVEFDEITQKTGLTLKDFCKWKNENMIKIQEVRQNIKDSTKLFRAIYDDSIDDVKTAIKKDGINANAIDIANRTILSVAISYNNIEIIKLLLENGAKESINIADCNKRTSLFWACFKDNIDVVKLLLRFGAKESINITDCSGNTPLCCACYNGNIDVVKLLLENGAEVSNIALDTAIDNGNQEIEKLLKQQ